MYKFNLSIKEKELIANLKQNMYTIALYGGNSSKQHIIKYCEHYNIDITCCIDEPNYTSINKWPINFMSADDFLQNYDNPLIILGSIERDPPALIKEKEIATLPWYALFEDSYDYQNLITIGAEAWCYANSMRKKETLNLTNHYLEFPYINICITQTCNLKCADCNHLIPYIPKPRHYDTKECIDAINQISQSIDYIHRLGILGGEAFLHPFLAEIIEHALSLNNIGYIVILTNGTIIPSNKILKILQNERVVLKISNYGPLSKELDNILPLLKNNKILYRILNDLTWTKFGPIYNRNRNDEDLKFIFKQCAPAPCYHVKWPYFYHCPYAGSLALIHPQQFSESERVDLRNDPSIIRQQLSELKKKILFRHCQYCEGGTGDTVRAAEQLIINKR